MDRRNFLDRLLSGGMGLLTWFGLYKPVPVAPSVPVGPPPPPFAHWREHPLSALERFNLQFKGYQYGEPVGNHLIFFTGFIPSLTHHDSIIGNWMAWPDRNWPNMVSDHPGYFVSSVPDPGWVGKYELGGSWPVVHTLHFDDLLDQQGQDHANVLVAQGRERLLKAMREAGAI